MAKSVTVLSLEGDVLRGVRLDAEGESYLRGPSDAWSLVAATGGDASADEMGVQDAEEVTETVVEEDRPLARAFRAAAKTFGTHEVALSVPLSRLLVKVVRLPIEARDDLPGAAQLELDAISPFPDELLTPGAEIVAETDTELVAVFAALPDAASAEIGEALAAAKVHVTRTDVTALAWLRGLWPQICERQDVRRRMVLLNLDGGWDLVLVVDGAPVFLRGIGRAASAAELVREVMLSQMQIVGVDGVDEVVVCAHEPPDEDFLSRLGSFGPVRTVLVEDENAGVEGAARRTVEGSSLDVTPEAWREARTENRFRRTMLLWMSVVGGLWLLLMGVLFGVDTAYDFMKDHQKRMQTEPRHLRAYREVKSLKDRVELIERYADHAHGALEVFKTVTECLPDSDMVFTAFKYQRDKTVDVECQAPDREDGRVFIDNLNEASFEDAKEDERLFATVAQDGGNDELRKGGYKVKVTGTFHSADEDGKGAAK